MALSPGDRLAQYTIVSPLGSGGMGEIYRARDTRLDRDVAVKVMAGHIASNPEMRRRFETEAKAVAALSHPSILSIHELLILDGSPVAVMELLEGETLRARMHRGTHPWRDAVGCVVSIAEGLAAAHAKGVIHRDLKPDNVFLTTDGSVKILDFGLALHRLDGPEGTEVALTTARTVPGTVLGTFGYMSPEQVRGERVDGRSDIFSLGCIVYEMLSGRRLFPGTTPEEIVGQLLYDSIPELSAFDPLAPPELRSIVARMVERERNHRFDAAADVAMALRSLLTASTGTGGTTGRRAKPRGKSLAVLPFINAGADPELDYIIDGITESIINSLSQLDGVRVVPRSLVFRYKGLQADPSTVGLALNARTIMTGRVMQQGDTLVLQAELVDTANEAQLWGERFRQKITDLVTVQEEIAWQISEALRLRLTGAQKKKLRKRSTVNAEAHQEYLRGRYHWNSWSPDGFRRAREHFERAIAHDTSYAHAYAGLADALGVMAYYGIVPPADGFPRSRAAAERAVALDPEIGDPHVALTVERLFWGWDWPEAYREIEKALELSPKLAQAHAIHSLLLSTCGKLKEALAAALRARDLEPLSLFNNMAVTWTYHFAGDFEGAVREAIKTREIAPALEEAGNVMISSYEAMGRFDDALALMETQACWGFRFEVAPLREALRTGGPRAYWLKRLEAMNQVSPAPPGIHFGRAIVHHYLGDLDQQLDNAERMVDSHVGGSVFIAIDPVLTSLRGHPRYEALIKRVGVPRPHAVSIPHTAST
jgi:eukaryotic-like serine/threonine-protein kinase